MISWSENRERTKSFSSSQLLEKLELINGLLRMLANDEDLHDDLQLPQVQIALKHFTGENRLPPDVAIKLNNDRRIAYVHSKILLLNNVSNSAHIPTGICYQHFLNRKPQLTDEAILNAYGKSKKELENYENNTETETIKNIKDMKNTNIIEGNIKEKHDTKSLNASYKLLLDAVLLILFCYILSYICKKYYMKF